MGRPLRTQPVQEPSARAAAARVSAAAAAPSGPLAPSPSDALGVHHPAVPTRRRRDPAIAVATEAPRQSGSLRRQGRLVLPRPRRLAPGRTVLPEHPAGAAGGHAEHRRDVPDAGPATGGARSFPEAASVRSGLSGLISATALRSRTVSPPISFRRRAWPVFRPPYPRRQRAQPCSPAYRCCLRLVAPIAFAASATLRPFATRTSAARSLPMFPSAPCRFLAILPSRSGQTDIVEDHSGGRGRPPRRGR